MREKNVDVKRKGLWCRLFFVCYGLSLIDLRYSLGGKGRPPQKPRKISFVSRGILISIPRSWLAARVC